MSADDFDEGSLLDTVAYVTSSEYRTLVVATLRDGTAQPSEIADGSDVARSHVSRALSELTDRDVVRAHGSESRAKLYSLTDLGTRVAGELTDASENQASTTDS